MVFKRTLSISPSPPKIKDNKSLSKSNSCKVCGDRAHANNYGALSCHPCKTFFRRNGFRPEVVRPCEYDGQCEVNMSTRTACVACRLKKCLSIGMSSHLIRKECYYIKKNSRPTKPHKTQTSACKTQMSVVQLPTLDLLRNDRSSLTDSEWVLFSNVVHAYDTFSLTSKLQHILKNLSSSSCETRFGTVDVLETVGSVFISMHLFVGSTPDFQVLNVKEQQSLLQRNLHGISYLSSHVFYRDTDFFDNAKCYESFRTVYESKMLKQAIHLMSQLDLDSTLLKLILLVIAFSSNCFIVDVHKNTHDDTFLLGTFRLFGSQNVYVELLWKYMIYRYGYCETVIRFSRLVTCTLGSIRLAASIYMSNDIHHELTNEVTKMAKETLIINQNGVVPLWGKTLTS